ncbi:hypothetical protein [Dietzia maris]|uniref:hypothetical protein n=1 Tax=Dietzia maris TaxID=37915 RepID=UPI0037C98621
MARLAWVAVIDRNSDEIALSHGAQVDGGEGWFAEAVWDGPFSREGLQSAKYLFGSAGYADASTFTVRASSALVDRVLTAESADKIIASNSLPALLAATGIELDPAHDYDAEWQAILAGVDSYTDRFRTSSSGWRVTQHFYGEIAVDLERFTVTRKRYSNVFAPTCFSEIESELVRVTEALANNARDGQRMAPMTLATTISSGYDSTGAAALAAAVGAEVAFTRSKSPTLLPGFLRKSSDSGRPAASALGLRVVEIADAPTRTWDPEVELGLLAGSPGARELLLLPVAADLAAAPHTSVLFTGYHGDKTWDMAPPFEAQGHDVRRGDFSGLTLAESRLYAGFLNVPLPFVGAEGISSFVEVSRSDEMAPWRLGGTYDRPIPRRIAEAAGVPRGVFGQKKSAVWSHVSPLSPVHPDLQRLRRSELRPNPITWSRSLTRAEVLARTALDRVARTAAKRSVVRVIPPRYGDQSVATFHWAVKKLTESYTAAL